MDGNVDSTLLTVLTRRKPLLEALSAVPTRKCDLPSDLDISRSTIDRGIRELEALDLVERDGRTYRSTLAGELALTEYDRFAGRVTDVVEARDILSSLPSTAPLDPVFLEGADVLVSQWPDPQTPVRKLEELISTATHHRAFAPAFLSHLVISYRDAIVDGLECEFALTPAVLDELVVHHREPVSEALSTGRVDLREAPETLPYTLVVSRDERGPDTESVVASILVYIDEGLKGIIYNDDPAAVEWAEQTLSEIWEESSPLEFPGG